MRQSVDQDRKPRRLFSSSLSVQSQTRAEPRERNSEWRLASAARIGEKSQRRSGITLSSSCSRVMRNCMISLEVLPTSLVVFRFWSTTLVPARYIEKSIITSTLSAIARGIVRQEMGAGRRPPSVAICTNGVPELNASRSGAELQPFTIRNRYFRLATSM